MAKDEISIPPLYGLRASQVADLLKYSTIRIESGFSFEPAGMFTQMNILGANGGILLSIPVKKHPKGTPLFEIHIDLLQKWQNHPWRSLQSAYGKSPYFNYYNSELEALFMNQPGLLIDFTGPLTHWILAQYSAKSKNTVILAPGQDHKIPESPLLLAWKMDKTTEGTPLRYTQVFGENFVPDLGAVDHLFCEGPKFWNF